VARLRRRIADIDPPTPGHERADVELEWVVREHASIEERLRALLEGLEQDDA
jgi:hypothetical protein